MIQITLKKANKFNEIFEKRIRLNLLSSIIFNILLQFTENF